MNPYIIFFSLFFFITIIDYLVLNFVLKNLFAKELKKFKKATRKIPAILAWLLMALGLYVFVAPWSASYLSAGLFGAFFGIILYGIYDFTNYAIFKDYTQKMIVIDLAWGIILTTAASIFLFYLKTL